MLSTSSSLAASLLHKLIIAVVHRPARASLPLTGVLPDHFDLVHRYRGNKWVRAQSSQLGCSESGFVSDGQRGLGIRIKLDRIHHQLLQPGQ